MIFLIALWCSFLWCVILFDAMSIFCGICSITLISNSISCLRATRLCPVLSKGSSNYIASTSKISICIHPYFLIFCSLIPEAEGISLVSEIIAAFPALTQRPYKITVNHTALLQAIFEHSGIPIDKHNEIKRALVEAKSEKMSKLQVRWSWGFS